MFDLTCGATEMLFYVDAHLKRQRKEWQNLWLFVREPNLPSLVISRMNSLPSVQVFLTLTGN